MMGYQNLRGGVVLMSPVTAPATTNWGTGLEAMGHALEMEKTINQVRDTLRENRWVGSIHFLSL